MSVTHGFHRSVLLASDVSESLLQDEENGSEGRAPSGITTPPGIDDLVPDFGRASIDSELRMKGECLMGGQGRVAGAYYASLRGATVPRKCASQTTQKSAERRM